MRSTRPWTVTPASGRFALDLRFERPAALCLVGALHRRDPVDGFQQPRRPQSAQHGMDRLVAKQSLGARAKLVGVALIVMSHSSKTL